MIVVMPDAAGEGENYTGRHMGYFNVPGWNYEQFFFEEFIPAVEKTTASPETKAHRAISGLSMAAAARRSTPCATPRSSARPAR